MPKSQIFTTPDGRSASTSSSVEHFQSSGKWHTSLQERECLIATNYFLYVTGNLRGMALGGRVAVKLMRLFIDWAEAKGAHELNVPVTSGIDPERTDRFLKRLALQPSEGNYAERLK